MCGECDEKCTELDLAMYSTSDSGSDDESQLLVEDDLPDAKPVLHYDASSSNTVRLQVQMFGWLQSDCGWKVRAYRQDEGETP